MDVFRASPWVPYQPTQMDVDMDAPEISTLHDDASPPPPAASVTKKLKAPKLKVTEPWSTSHPRPDVTGAAKEAAEGEDEEDELVDDEPPLSASVSSAAPTPKKKPATKRKTKKEKEAEEEAKKAAAEQAAGKITVEGGSAPPESIILKISAAAKRKQTSTPRKSAGATRGRGRGGKTKAPLTPHLYVDDAGMSEAGYTGTAPSSPGTTHPDPQDLNDADPLDVDGTVAPSSPPAAPSALPEETPINSLEGVAIPQYPLPTRPFPVMPPVKIATGFAPPIPLDRTGKKVRHWRVAHREIRGIAGGRWFAKTWVGEKESEYATATGTNGEDKLGLSVGLGSKLVAGLSASAPVGKVKGKAASKAASVVASAVPSRAASPGPDGSVSVARPTKMRILQMAPSEAGDSDMAPPDS